MMTGLKTVAVFLTWSACLSGTAQKTKSLHLVDGRPFTVTGKLEIQFSGWRSTLLVQTNKSYTADFGEEADTKRVREIELNTEGNGNVLAKHAGETITASGHLQLEGVSSYYWNGVMLMADAVTLADGTVLRKPQQKQHQVPADVRGFLYTVFMVPKQFTWRHEAVDLRDGHQLPDPDVAGCSLNGGADILNCFCADGFIPVRAGVVDRRVSPANLERIPAAELPLPGMAQFGIPEDAIRPMTVQVACKRKNPGTK
jgi:hypothetical protein